MTIQTLEAAIQQVRDLADRTQHLLAYDTADNALATFPDALELRYLAVLELARAGATLQAQERFVRYALMDQLDDARVAALDARIAKDLASRITDADQRAVAYCAAAARYARVFEQAHTCYPAVNAATLYALGANMPLAREYARAALGAVPQGSRDYFECATRGEAFAVLGEFTASETAFAEAIVTAAPTLSMVATTRKQLALLSAGLAIAPEVTARLFEALAQPRVAHYCGQSGNADGGIGALDADAIATMTNDITGALVRRNVGIAYGSLSAGAEIVLAETMLAHGVDLHVILPLPLEEFLRVRVAPYGAVWQARFAACLARASEVLFATDDEHLGNDQVFDYGAHLAMGLALLRARHLCSDVVQFAIWQDHEEADALRSTSLWRELGHRSELFGAAAEELLHEMAHERDDAVAPRAMLFGDVKGFSRLRERQLPIFVREVLGRFANVIASYGDDVLFRNTWGDGIFIVVRDAQRAATLAFDLQQAMREIDLLAVGLPADHALRLGAHFGPILRTADPVLGTANYFGAHVSRAARIEPITPEGEIFVSEQFAAQLELRGNGQFRTEYVGEVPAAKNYGRLRMYVLSR